jgi:hypothetical protein
MLRRLTAEQSRRYAAECVRLAAEMNSPGSKETLLAHARGWLGLAEEQERIGRGIGGERSQKVRGIGRNDRAERTQMP